MIPTRNLSWSAIYFYCTPSESLTRRACESRAKSVRSEVRCFPSALLGGPQRTWRLKICTHSLHMICCLHPCGKMVQIQPFRFGLLSFLGHLRSIYCSYSCARIRHMAAGYTPLHDARASFQLHLCHQAWLWPSNWAGIPVQALCKEWQS